MNPLHHLPRELNRSAQANAVFTVKERDFGCAPDWTPLETHYPAALELFMFMGSVVVQDLPVIEKQIQCYKNIRTRQYINLDNDGNFYVCRQDGSYRIDENFNIGKVL